MQTDALKHAAADAAALHLKDGMIVGLGSGSTALFAVEAIARRIANGLRIVCISTSEKTSDHARELNVPMSTLEEHPDIDITIDGADEVERNTLALIKGGGGNLLREKIVAVASKQLIIVVDETKVVDQLGAHALPIDVVPFAWQTTAKRIAQLGSKPNLRKDESGQTFVTDGGHYILDCEFTKIPDPAALQTTLNNTVGIVEHGLFIGMANQVIVGAASGIRTLLPNV